MADIKQWQMSDNAAEYYEQIAARYIIGPWATNLIDASDLQEDEKVLDLACGTGLVSRAAAKRLGPSGHISALDLNSGMLKVAARIGVAGPCKVEWMEGSALDLPIEDGTVDVVLCQQGLQFFPDQPLALSECWRVLRDGGRTCFSIWAGAGPYNEAVSHAVSLHIDDNTARQYQTTRDVPDAESLRQLFENAGFKSVKVTREELFVRLPEIEKFVISHLLGTPISTALQTLSEKDQKQLAKDVALHVKAFADGNDVVVPDRINLVRATK